MKGRRPAPSGSANRGKPWEELLELHHRRYEAQGLGMMFRTPPPVKLLEPRAGGRWLAVMVAEGPPDYTGIMRTPRGPVPFAAEAKNNADGRWALKQLHQHQAEALQRYQLAGGLAVVLLNHQPQRTGYVLPWYTLAPVWGRWHALHEAGEEAPPRSASLGDGDLAVLGLPFKPEQGYLPALLAAWERRPV